MPLKKPTQKGGHVRTRRLLAAIPEDLYKALKYKSVETDTDMKDIVAEALRKHLGFKKGGESSKK
jgi:hypothetical protein